jgi:hypothetical protein
MARRNAPHPELDAKRHVEGRIVKRVGACLRHWEKDRKAIRSMPGPGQVKLWELVR